MDITVIKEALGDFATFARNFSELMQGIPNFLAGIGSLFQPVEGTDQTLFEVATEQTSSNFGSSEN